MNFKKCQSSKHLSCQIHFVLLLCFLSFVLCEDYYELLGVAKDADNREIRKAFKKLALIKHPDKNLDDPAAHDVFVKINRAYEVLKDEETRKKYDMHGEEGLKDDFQRGRHYESWNFYQQDFGIYDDDPEIVTLDQSDFEQSVQNSEDVWFINFYSPRCGHCHDLAPTWRELARELEGVIRIGAINCADDWGFCRQQGIRSYPSLVLYPKGKRYDGERSTSEMVEYVLKHLNIKLADLVGVSFNLNDEMQNLDEEKAYPWLITFCSDEGDCLSYEESLKLAAILKDLVLVTRVHCDKNLHICNSLNRNHGTAFYPVGGVEKSKEIVITSLDTKEIAFQVLSQLPDVTVLNKEEFENILQLLPKNQDSPWLIIFTDQEDHDLELRKLPVMLNPLQVGRVDCRIQRSKCNELHVHKFPSFVLFKQGGGYEIHHGRTTAHDIAVFARESASAPVRVLGPADFPHPVSASGEPWFVDFYAPWCPPCMRLLPEFRKASKMVDPVISFGTVDCTVHHSLCQQYNIKSYPTTIFYNQSTPHHFQGHHRSDALLEFVEDVLNPTVIALDPSSFQQNVMSRGKKEIWLVDFFAPWCGPCRQIAPEWRKLAKMLKNSKNLYVASVDCQAHGHVCQQNGVHNYPTLRLYPLGGKNNFQVFNGWFRDAPNLRAWVLEFLPKRAIALTFKSFTEKVLKSKYPWLIDFYTPWCGQCKQFAPEFEQIAEELEGKVKCGKVDCDQHQYLCKHASIRFYPNVRFYGGVTSKTAHQGMQGYELHSDFNNIVNYVKKQLSKKKNKKHDEL